MKFGSETIYKYFTEEISHVLKYMCIILIDYYMILYASQSLMHIWNHSNSFRLICAFYPTFGPWSLKFIASIEMSSCFFQILLVQFCENGKEKSDCKFKSESQFHYMCQW